MSLFGSKVPRGFAPFAFLRRPATADEPVAVQKAGADDNGQDTEPRPPEAAASERPQFDRDNAQTIEDEKRRISMSKQYDLVVIGGGPGGYVASIRAAQLGLQVACIEKRGTLGGTCLNVGCIPSKALLHSSELFETAKHDFAGHGIEIGTPSVNLAAMMARKDKVVDDLTKGIEFLFKKNKVDYVVGAGTITGPNQVAVSGGGLDGQTLETKRILIATGSEVTPLPGVEIDEERIVSSTGALGLDKVPGKMIVIGAGVIGLEMGSVWSRLGAQVTVVEYLDRITPGMDKGTAKQLQRTLTKQGLAFKLGQNVTGVEKTDQDLKVSIEPAKGGDGQVLEADIVLVAIGRRPFTQGLGLENVGLELNERGQVPINDTFQTAVPSIFAIGDVVRGAMLAHKAEEEGVVCVELMVGQKPHINYDAIPGIIYTWPEVATVGKGEEDLKEAGQDYKVGQFPFSANSRARAMGQSDGFVKLLTDAKTDRLLGAHIIGPNAGELIQELVTVLEFGGASEDIARTTHGHPTLSEAVKEAALAVEKRAIHA